MVAILVEGFDKYGPAGVQLNELAALMDQEWTSNGTMDFKIDTGLSSTGTCLKTIVNSGTSAFISRTLPSSYGTLYCGFRFNCAVLASQMGVSFRNSSTEAFAVWINSTGNIVVGNAGIGSTALATSSQSVSVNSTHYLEIAVTFSTTGTGSYEVWLDGVATSLNASSQTLGAATANVFIITCGNSGGVGNAWDDLYLFDNTGGTNNNVLLSNPRVETEFPNSDSAVAFTFGAGVLGIPYSYDQSTVSAPGANELMLRPFTPPVNCTISSISIIPGTTSGAANLKPCIYDTSAGAPHNLLSSGSQVTGTTNLVTLTMPLTTPQALTGGTQYWIGYITDTNLNMYETDTGKSGYKAANTYGSGAPNPAPAMTSGQPSWTIWGNLTAGTGNYPQADLNPAAGILSYNFSSTVSQEDLYGYPSLSSTPSNIYTVKVSALVAKSDSGTRTANLRMKSASSESSGSSSAITPATTFGWIVSFFDTDPNTGSAWTSTGLNSAKSGVQVNS